MNDMRSKSEMCKRILYGALFIVSFYLPAAKAQVKLGVDDHDVQASAPIITNRASAS